MRVEARAGRVKKSQSSRAEHRQWPLPHRNCGPISHVSGLRGDPPIDCHYMGAVDSTCRPRRRVVPWHYCHCACASSGIHCLR